MIRLIYNLLFPFALLLFLPRYFVKMLRRGQYAHKFGQRLGFYDRDVRVRLAERRSVWMHAVSVGEVAIALKLAQQMKALQPELTICLTITTTTGFAVGRQQAADWIEVMYSPLDFWPVMRRAFQVVNPMAVVLIEAEVWPNLTAEAHRRAIPIALVNARLSKRSERRFQRFRFIVAPTFKLLDLVCVQEAEDVERWSALGIPRSRIRDVGSIKFDIETVGSNPERPRQILSALGVDSGRPILLAGSTHPGEEEIVGEIFTHLRLRFPSLFLIVAPRHVERAQQVRAMMERLGCSVALRTDTASGRANLDALILNSTGELRDWYAVATVVFVGKSLSARGGQNPVEPIVAERPVVFGPHMENFAVLAHSLVTHEAAVQVADAAELERVMGRLLGDEAARRKLVERAHDVLAAHHGATRRTADLVATMRAQKSAPAG